MLRFIGLYLRLVDPRIDLGEQFALGHCIADLDMDRLDLT